jgi:hypothetical protein
MGLAQWKYYGLYIMVGAKASATKNANLGESAKMAKVSIFEKWQMDGK